MESGYKYYLKGCSMPRNTVCSSLKNCSTKDFINRFNKIPSYNAIHAKSSSSVGKESNKNMSQESSKKISLLKLFASSKKRQLDKPILLKNSGINDEKRRKLIKNLIRQKSNLDLKSQNKSCKYPKINKVQHKKQCLEQINRQISKLNNQRFSLKVNPSKCTIDQVLSIQRRIQRNTFTPFDDTVFNKYQKQKYDGMEHQYIQLIKSNELYNPNQFYRQDRISYSSQISDNQIQQRKLTKQKTVILRQAQQIRESMQSLQRQLTEQMMNNDDLNENQLKQYLISHKNIIKSSKNKIKNIHLKTESSESDKQNNSEKFLRALKHSYIKNFIKTTNIQRGQPENQLDITHDKSLKNIFANQKIKIKDTNLISILHPDGEFSKDFNYQFKPW